MSEDDKHAEIKALATWMRANGVNRFAIDGMEIEVDLYYELPEDEDM